VEIGGYSMRCSPRQTKAYIAEQVAELAKLAAGAKLKELARLLELATFEANRGQGAEQRPQRAA
jgi:hypothetical protein